ncbi:MAG: 16S rRNA (adenine(1518)-N(6)/adenine(1519)-N(6))-dimethyltransferase RsmA [Syntrophomonadaceae bacterium]|jgi:16S rRNA (adenine1518-N6/adenine1519-N6)-dimethyltransferase|nr:16S rRNA (adenine(1518)-N(6)/adenine(1519)-N(6))-dimethyltransferase RsmA [Syntrophomonadaceae bacterium]
MIKPDSISGLKSVLKEYSIKPYKAWGQNFLADRNVLRNIAEKAGLSGQEYAVEIGPGLGALTVHLLPRCKGLLAVDVDARFEEPLKAVIGERPDFRLLIRDVLSVDLEAELAAAFSLPEAPSFSVCANIPYHITSPIIFKLLEQCPRLRTATLLMQKEVGERILARPGTKSYGLLTIMTQWYAEAVLLMKVSRNCFVPKPEVDSVIVRFHPRAAKLPCRNEDLFKRLVRVSFQLRRKTLSNICVKVFGENKRDLEAQLVNLGIDPQRRPETLTISEFILIADELG